MQKRNADKLQYAIRSLENALKYSQSGEFQVVGIEFKSVLVATVAQNFHLTFAVCRQMITRQLIDRLGAEVVEKFSPVELFQMAAKEGIITPLTRWLEYLDCDSSTASNGAFRAFEKAAAFLEDAGELLRTCVTRSLNERRQTARQAA